MTPFIASLRLGTLHFIRAPLEAEDVAHQHRNVEDEGDFAASEDRRAADTVKLRKYFPERFDNRLKLPEQLVDDKAISTSGVVDDDDVGARVGGFRLIEQIADVEEREDCPAQVDVVVPVHLLFFAIREFDTLDDHVEGDNVERLSHFDQEAVNDRQRERETDNKARPLPDSAFDLDISAKCFDVPFDDVHPDTATREVGDGRCGRESRFQDEFVNLLLS